MQNGLSRRGISHFQGEIVIYEKSANCTNQLVYNSENLRPIDDRKLEDEILPKSKLMFGASSKDFNYVTDVENGIIWKFDSWVRKVQETLNLLFAILMDFIFLLQGNVAKIDKLKMSNLTGVTLDPKGNIIVATSGQNECKLHVFSPDESYVRHIALDGNLCPTGICLQDNFFYLTDVRDRKINVYSVIQENV